MKYEIVAHMEVETKDDEPAGLARDRVIECITKSTIAKRHGIRLTEAIYKAPTLAKVVSVIPAEVHDNEYKYSVDFDCLPWFQQAPTCQIIDLAAIDWGGDQASDYVAMFFEDIDDEIGALFNYVYKSKIGYECHIDKDKALKWIKENKPRVYTLLEEEGLLEEEE